MNIPETLSRQLILTGVADQIYEIIRERIITHSFKPGEKIDIQLLTDEFGTSQMPVRDALKHCADEGLVYIVPRVGYYVVQFNAKDVYEIFDLRKLLEVRALELGIDRMETAKILSLKEDLGTLKLVKNETDFTKGFFETDVRLHALIVQSADNTRLRMFARQIHAQVDIIRHMSKLYDLGLDEHLGIVKAIIEKDLALAKQLLSQHIDKACEAAIATLNGKTGT